MALIFGLVFGGIGTAMNEASGSVDDYSQDSNYASCMGEVIDVDDASTTIQYEADGNFYRVGLNMSSSAYPVGTSVTVYYNKTKPDECSVPEIAEETLGTMSSIFSGVGVGLLIGFAVVGIAGLVGGILLIRSSAKKVE